MANVNHMILGGRLTRDPERKGDGWGIFSIAHNTRKKENGEWTDGVTLFMDCKAFKAVFDTVESTCQKGTEVLIIGRLEAREWQNDAGETRKALSLVADQVAIVPAKVQREQYNDPARDDEGYAAHQAQQAEREQTQATASAALPFDVPEL